VSRPWIDAIIYAMREFSALALIDPLQLGLKEVGYGQMTPVQA